MTRTKTPLAGKATVDPSRPRGKDAARSTASDLALTKFPTPEIPRNRGLGTRVLWYLVSGVFFQHAFALWPSITKTKLLKLFGANIGNGVVIKPSVTIKYPWFLSIGDHSWIGQGVWIDNPGPVTIGANVCISQGAYLVTGNHDFTDPSFRFFCQPIKIGDRVWICAKAVISPGSVIPSGTIVAIGTVWNEKIDQGRVHPSSS